MKRGNNLINQIGVMAGLEGHPLPGVPIIELAGDSRVLIENHLRIQEYLSHCVKISVAYGYVRIKGKDLEIVHMSSNQLVISGTILSVELERSKE